MAREENRGAASDEELEEDIAGAAVFNAAQYLQGVDFPIRKEGLMRQAEDNGADEPALEELRMLPDDRTFRSEMEVFEALGSETEGL